MTYKEAYELCFDGYAGFDGRDYYAISDEWFNTINEALAKLMEIEELIQACEGCETAYGMREYPCAEAYHDIVKVMRGEPIFQ